MMDINNKIALLNSNFEDLHDKIKYLGIEYRYVFMMAFNKHDYIDYLASTATDNFELKSIDELLDDDSVDYLAPNDINDDDIIIVYQSESLSDEASVTLHQNGRGKHQEALLNEAKKVLEDD